MAGAVLLASVVYAALHSRSALLGGHWAYLVWVVAMAVLAVVLLIAAFVAGRPRRGVVRAILRWAGVAFAIGLAAITAWLAPYEADPVPTAATQTANTGILLMPQDPGDTGVAFIPGALVDPRAYEQIFAPVVAAGYPVFIVKPPLGVAFTVPDAVADAEVAAPEVEQWVIAGHSLGGAVASDQLDNAAGLMLLGSYPIGDISSQEIPVLSVSGSNDAFTTPQDIEQSMADLPDGTTFVVVEGGIHAYFGDYGLQRGDGSPGIPREQAQEQIQASMLKFLNDLPAAQP
ncbi:MAG: alpha/beta hydrolase [Actinobacteria bacterium]|nr:alpha/beta hydrolase [Actinomycetota bacterium]